MAKFYVNEVHDKALTNGLPCVKVIGGEII